MPEAPEEKRDLRDRDPYTGRFRHTWGVIVEGSHDHDEYHQCQLCGRVINARTRKTVLLEGIPVDWLL